MDRELVIWMVVFFGGYGVVLGWLLKIALTDNPRTRSPQDGG